MKSIVLSSALVALLVLTGCSSKDASLSDAEKSVQEQAANNSSTNNGMNSEVIDSSTLSSMEKDFSSVYFDFDKFTVNADNKSKIVLGAKIANEAASSLTMKLEGNCDEWGSDEYNFALGLKRANAVKKSLVASGVDANRITMVSYGESNPACSDKTQSCWSENRRVDFKLLP